MYDKNPYVKVTSCAEDCSLDWEEIGTALRESLLGERCILCVECYPGVDVSTVTRRLIDVLNPSLTITTQPLFRSEQELASMLSSVLTDDPVFGILNNIEISDFLDKQKVMKARDEIQSRSHGIIVVVGTGAAEVAEDADVLIYADLARWEIQQRQRKGEIGNLGLNNVDEAASQKYKRAFFVDWRAADCLKRKLLAKIDFLLDTNDSQVPKLISGKHLRMGLERATERPIRVVPFFDPGPWGGHWMEREFDLPRDVPNYAWCFDCVPEENSLLLGFGDTRVEIPAINLIFFYPERLLGNYIHERFGAEFPIRFDFLDTIEGGNLSLQVHPLAEYVHKHFGLTYTQDESYYILDAARDASVYLGLKEGINRESMLDELRSAEEESGGCFDADKYVCKWHAQKHDHFLIPAGTIHCSGSGSMVLEISATPYIFTFKLWDWGRVGLNGQPRPIHLERGAENIQWNRTEEWVRGNLINQIVPVTEGDGWREERTGLHAFEFIETRRHWFVGSVPHDTAGTVNVLNLVQGEEIIVESPTGSFDPFVVHYAETFIVPANVGSYLIRPHGPSEGRECATIKAFVRQEQFGDEH